MRGKRRWEGMSGARTERDDGISLLVFSPKMENWIIYIYIFWNIFIRTT